MKDQDRGVDLKEVAALISALERDLAKVSGGSADLQSLKDEVETLRKVLNSPRPKPGRVSDALHGVRVAMERAVGTVAGEAIRDWPYIAEIGRMLGMR